MATKPQVTAELAWAGDLRFTGRSGESELILDSEGRAGPSPVQALVLALAGCMSIDVVHILTKSRQPLRGLTTRLSAERAPEDPKRLVKVGVHFALEGDVPADRIERAVRLSREKYCSIWHSLRTDIELTTSFEVRPAVAPTP